MPGSGMVDAQSPAVRTPLDRYALSEVVELASWRGCAEAQILLRRPVVEVDARRLAQATISVVQRFKTVCLM